MNGITNPNPITGLLLSLVSFRSMLISLLEREYTITSPLCFIYSSSDHFSIEGVVEKWQINETFVGVILLPIVGK